MQTKLTLRLENEIVNKMKIFVAKKRVSLSKFTETLYSHFIEEDQKEHDFSPVVRKYKGLLKNIELNDTSEISDYLSEKH